MPPATIVGAAGLASAQRPVEEEEEGAREEREKCVGPTCKRHWSPAPPPADVDKWTRALPVYAFIHRKRILLFFGLEYVFLSGKRIF